MRLIISSSDFIFSLPFHEGQQRSGRCANINRAIGTVQREARHYKRSRKLSYLHTKGMDDCVVVEAHGPRDSPFFLPPFDSFSRRREPVRVGQEEKRKGY